MVMPSGLLTAATESDSSQIRDTYRSPTLLSLTAVSKAGEGRASVLLS